MRSNGKDLHVSFKKIKIKISEWEEKKTIKSTKQNGFEASFF